MILRSPAENENPDIRHAGMDGRHPGPRDASGDIHVTWIPALHAGMTQSRSRTKTDPDPPPHVFSKEDTKSTKKDSLTAKSWEDRKFQIWAR